jgi:hypothetical protein
MTIRRDVWLMIFDANEHYCGYTNVYDSFEEAAERLRHGPQVGRIVRAEEWVPESIDE